MFWFFVGSITGAFLYSRVFGKREVPIDAASVLYLEEQIASHEYLMNYHKKILLEKTKITKKTE
jgi:hypothetical protein